MNRRWLIKRTNPEYLHYFSKAASVSPLIAQILITRGMKAAGDIHDFLHPVITGLSDPFELPGMKASVERIKAALRGGERILVHGDYDTDGLTSTAILVHALKTMGMDVTYFIPNRMAHGYGFHPPSVDMAVGLGAGLIITVDCGITSLEAAAYAREKGIDVIITDHHEPIRRSKVDSRRSSVEPHEDVMLPDAVAIVNPKLTTADCRMSSLSGAGVAFKISQAFAMDPGLPFSMDDALSLLDLAALGTLADVVALVGDNRIIVREGLRHINAAERPAMRSLLQVSGIREREMKAGLLSYTVVPRINAAGRIDDAREVMRLLLSDSLEEALSIAAWLDRTNTERQRIEETVYQEAISQLSSKGFTAAIVLYGTGWHLGVIGIVASRFAEEFCRPAFVFTVEDGVAKGSARSIPGFDVYRGLSECRDILMTFGGHKQAAGVKLSAANLPAFEERMSRLVGDFLEQGDRTPSIEIDAGVNLSEINAALMRELSLLEPFGYGYPEPILGAKRLEVLNPRVVGNNHLKMRLRQRSSSFDAIGFDMGKLFENLPTTAVDAAFTPTINDWNGSRSLQLTVKAFRPSL